MQRYAYSLFAIPPPFWDWLLISQMFIVPHSRFSYSRCNTQSNSSTLLIRRWKESTRESVELEQQFRLFNHRESYYWQVLLLCQYLLSMYWSSCKSCRFLAVHTREFEAKSEISRTSFNSLSHSLNPSTNRSNSGSCQVRNGGQDLVGWNERWECRSLEIEISSRRKCKSPSFLPLQS